jgi:hypothetical protein
MYAVLPKEKKPLISKFKMPDIPHAINKVLKGTDKDMGMYRFVTELTIIIITGLCLLFGRTLPKSWWELLRKEPTK